MEDGMETVESLFSVFAEQPEHRRVPEASSSKKENAESRKRSSRSEEGKGEGKGDGVEKKRRLPSGPASTESSVHSANSKVAGQELREGSAAAASEVDALDGENSRRESSVLSGWTSLRTDGLSRRVLLNDGGCLHEVIAPVETPSQFKEIQIQTTIKPEKTEKETQSNGADTESPDTAKVKDESESEDSENQTADSESASKNSTEVKAARQWKFKLDLFQQRSIICLEFGESVLVAAHTSAGKTVVAEYAIAMGLRDKQRVVYTSPIKALSNQKYRDLCEIFGSDNVGLLTGDVSVHPEASVLVMTTEILRNMLYRGSALVREVRWVIYDEIHYMRDRERGVVWEESLILLPRGSRQVFLSATIQNAAEFASWIASLRGLPCHVIYTEKRPTPLQHYVYPKGGDGVFLVVDELKQFKADNFARAIEQLQSEGQPSTTARKNRGGNSNSGRNSISKIVLMCEMRKYTPVIVFSFSKRECEANAQALMETGGNKQRKEDGSGGGGVDLTTDEEKKLIAEVFRNAVQTLDEQDRQLPQIKSILPLLLRGIGIHHGGLLPFVKELVEILFQESLVRVLFSTETFSMGLNMPAKTVVFSAIRKWDGMAHRLLNTGEYVQMAGRAGRRGLDDRGIAIIMLDEQVDPEEARGLFTGSPPPLLSTFHLGFSMLVNLYRIEDANPAFMISRSFAHFQQHRRSVRLEKELQQLEEEVKQVADIRLMVQLPEGEKAPEFDVDEEISRYYALKHELLQHGKQLRSIAMQPQHLVRFLQPGRLVYLEETDGTHWGWGTVVRKLQKRKVASQNPSELPTELLLVHCLVCCDPASLERCKSNKGGAASGDAFVTQRPKPAKSKEEEGVDFVAEVIPFSIECVSKVSKCKMALPAGGEVDSPDAKRSVAFQQDVVERKFQDLVSAIASAESVLAENKFTNHPLRSLYYEAHRKRVEMKSRIRQLQAEISKQNNTTFKDSLRCMRRVLHRLGFLEGNDVVTLKGRVACEISTADELLAAELLFSNALSDLAPAELCAVLSCLVAHEKHDEPEPKEPNLLAGVMKVREAARSIGRVFVECGYSWGAGGVGGSATFSLEGDSRVGLRQTDEQQQQQEQREAVAVEAYVDNFKHSLVSFTYGWANGKPFSELIQGTSLFEGSVVRSIRRLEELFRQLACACRAVGNQELEQKCVEGIRILRRGIVFSSSLYL